MISGTLGPLPSSGLPIYYSFWVVGKWHYSNDQAWPDAVESEPVDRRTNRTVQWFRWPVIARHFWHTCHSFALNLSTQLGCFFRVIDGILSNLLWIPLVNHCHVDYKNGFAFGSGYFGLFVDDIGVLLPITMMLYRRKKLDMPSIIVVVVVNI